MKSINQISCQDYSNDMKEVGSVNKKKKLMEAIGDIDEHLEGAKEEIADKIIEIVQTERERISLDIRLFHHYNLSWDNLVDDIDEAVWSILDLDCPDAPDWFNEAIFQLSYYAWFFIENLTWTNLAKATEIILTEE